jgi:deazaflavin-dependent oxidoreductase (nitroreductase family)
MNPMQRLAARTARSPWLERRSDRVIRVDLLLRRLTGGRVTLLSLAGLPELFLTVTGRDGGDPRTRPVVGVPSNGGWLVVGALWGARERSTWELDLLEAGRAHVEHHGRHTTVDARLLRGEERAGAWAQLVRAWPPFAQLSEDPDREPHVFFLSPTR